MKHLKTLTTLFTLAFLIISCSDDDDGQIEILNAGTLSGGPFTFTVDGTPDMVSGITLDSSSLNGDVQTYVITDDANNILGLPPTMSDVEGVNFDGAGAGVCLIWHLTYNEGLTGLEVGNNVSQLVGDYDISNSVIVIRNASALNAGTLSGGPFTFTVDGTPDMVSGITLDSSNLNGDVQTYVITDDANNILGLPPTLTDVEGVNFDGAGAGVCLIWHLTYNDGLTGLEVGNNVSQLGGDFALSNSITVIRNAIAMANFKVTIENVMEAKDYFANGITSGLIEPGMSATFSFNAGPGHYLSFATMMVQSNDLFVAPDDMGIALYDGSGNAITGDVTSMLYLWDAGTEVNEEPGVGANQAPRQSGANTGTDENGTVELISNINDGFTYPAVDEMIEVSLSHYGGTEFTVTLKNISDTASLATPFAPGTWVVHGSGQNPLFTEGAVASEGIERIAEDGNTSVSETELTAASGLVSPFAPGAFGINEAVFTIGETASAALQALAEDGDPSGFTNHFNTPVGAGSPGVITPGASYEFEFSAQDGDMLSFATMFVQSNDWIVGAKGIDLFENGTAITGDISTMLYLIDPGTEVDEYAGAGANQAPRQSAANTGADENGTIQIETNAGAHVPSVSNMLKVTISVN